MTLIFPIIENINTNSKSVSKLNIQCVISEYFVDDEKYQMANAPKGDVTNKHALNWNFIFTKNQLQQVKILRLSFFEFE